MEVLTVIGAIASITQLLHFAHSLAEKLQAPGPPQSNSLQDIGNQLPLLVLVLQRVRNDFEAGKIAVEDQAAVQDALNGCQAQLKDLSQLLQDLHKPPDAGILERATQQFRRPRQAKRALRIYKAFETYKTTFGLYLGQSVWSTIDRPQRHVAGGTVYLVPSNKISKFIGREEALAELDQASSSASVSDPSPHVITITGMGGIGKTQLVLQHCQRKRIVSNVLWADASSPALLATSFETLLQELPGRPTTLPDTAARIAYVKRYLSESANSWLLIFDNLDHPSSFSSAPIQNYFPSGANGCIIILSRHMETQRLGFSIALDVMTLDDGLDLLFFRTSRPRSPEGEADGARIVKRLGRLPLAIDQAGAYIAARGIEFSDFVSQYETRRDDVLRHVPELWEYRRRGPESENEHLLSVSTTWEMSFQQLAGEAADKERIGHFFTVAAFLQNKSIPEEIFKAYFESTTSPPAWIDFSTNGVWDHAKFENILVQLRSLSLLEELRSEASQGSCFSLHPVVQEWAQLRQVAPQTFAEEAIEVLSASMGEDRLEKIPLSASQNLIPHLEACIQNDSRFLQTRLGSERLRIPAERFASFYKRHGKYREGKALRQRTLDFVVAELGESHRSTFEATVKLGRFYYKEASYSEAKELYQKALIGQEQYLGRDDPDTLQSLVDIAATHLKEGLYGSAEPLMHRVQAAQKKSLGEHHPKRLWSMMILGMVYKKQGRFEEADNLYVAALHGQEQQLGLDHPDTTKTAMNLASVRYAQGRYDEAEVLSKRVVESRGQTLGPLHPNTLRALWNLGRVYLGLGQYYLADELFKRALEGQELQLGPEHAFTLRTLAYSAQLAFVQKDYKIATTLFQRAFRGLEVKCGSSHPNTLWCAHGLANVYRDQGFHTEAGALYQRVVGEYYQIWGKSHPEVLRITKDMHQLR